MPTNNANTTPVFTNAGDLSSDGVNAIAAALTAAANDFTGVSASYVLVHTALGVGTFIDNLRFKARGTNVASGARIFLNNGGAVATAANNFFFEDVALPATTANANGQTGPSVTMPMRIMIPAGWRVYVGLNTTVAGGWGAMAIAGKY